MKVYYRVEHEDDDDRQGPVEIDDLFQDKRWLTRWAQKCADHYHASGGWENSWPLKFTLFDAQDNVLGVFDVECDWVPEFFALAVYEPEGKK